MRNICLIFLLMGVGSHAGAINYSQMEHLDCTYTTDDINVIKGTDSCGEYRICEAPAQCIMIDKDVLAKEYGGDQAKAKEGAKTWMPDLKAIHLTKQLWSELSGTQPKFLTVTSKVTCKSRGSKCMNAKDCLKDKTVDFVGTERLDSEMTNVLRPELPGASR